MMKKKNLKYMFTILIFMLVLMLNKSSYGKVLTDETIGLSPYVLNGRNGGTIYCVEQGVRFSGWSTFHVTGVYDVQDPVLAYIINMTDNEQRGNWGLKDKKQNMIWWYMNNYNTSSEANIIKGYAGMYRDWTSNWPAWNTLNVGDLSTDITYANNDANKINNAKVKITNTEIKNNNLIISITAENIDKVKVFVNDKEASQEVAQSTYKISLENLDGASYATVKVVGINNVKKAKFQVLYNPYYQLQTLINTIAEGTKEETVATDTKTVPINTNVSLQKYITKVNNIELKDTKITTLTERINACSKVSGTNDVSKNNAKRDVNKQDNIVSIEAGDYVTYRIYVYNNSAVNASNVKIKDTLPTLTKRKLFYKWGNL